ncbi:pilus assembly PilX family protein [Undibacterium oligocarboniphilum]|uniref:Pilus assembly protein n=1 Tax=Undibacterium oligocarboniphilum TaxID=666702 RepID=A0A850QEA0_9BURK|nr:PilX N-terminal domain-containing pilus assembly protein [Undibacterium oligocarboniphilum]MBC3871285.1 pilus assembly protein [Undibacterium oligocarboniphilum]NVO78782.1 pilus assembly protein [Undibacterium oligocarboniphilum]
MFNEKSISFDKYVYRYLPGNQRQKGISLVVSLLMLIVVLVLSMSLTTISLQGEKASRNDRDRQIALMSAEAALKDAEMDIDPQVALANGRSNVFDATSNLFFEAGCASGDGNLYQGMCLPAANGQTPVWLSIDLSNDAAGAPSVKYGRFTGQTMVAGKGAFPAKLPRYIIEAVQDVEAGGKADEQTKYFFRITAIGFGPNPNTQVVLQSFYRKAVRS